MNKYDDYYNSEDLFWGKKESSSANRLVRLLKSDSSNDKKKILELGCGEGRDSIFFANNGIDVTAIDSSYVGIDKLQKICNDKGISNLKAIASSIENFNFEEKYDSVFSIGTLHYIPKEKRPALFEKIKNSTKIGGINLISVFCKKPFIKENRAASEIDNLFFSGELMEYYKDWEILFVEEKIKDCNSGNVPHKHVKDTIITKRII